jgi:flavin reductase (DIM6/NTAB) family NADH-FMN oxidoreductase RutF
MARFPTGVMVMTTTVGGVPHGMTANAVTSVSLDPLLVLVCVSREAVMAALVERTRVFALSLLSRDQQHLSEHFADPERSVGIPGFADVPTSTAVTGAPLLAGAIAHIDCEVEALHPGGDHVIVVGRVVHLGLERDGAPLVYHLSRYTTVEGS